MVDNSSPWCVSDRDAAGLLALTGLCILITTLIIGSAASGSPLPELGRRPIGWGVWTYLLNSLGAGVWGYDSILGAWSPPIRLLFHLASSIGFWSLSTYVGADSPEKECYMEFVFSPFVLKMGLATLFCYCGFFLVLYNLFHGVSHPGGPRDHKIQRQPEWVSRVTTLESLKHWRCAVAEDSHQVTHARFACTGQKLSGEPAGRQMWTFEAKEGEEEAIVKEMASGGRSNDGFNPSENPNSCDKIFRAQQIRNFLAGGGSAPSYDPATTPAEAAKKGAHFYSMLQTEDGHWAGDYGGPHFLMPGLIIAWYVMGKPELMLNAEQRQLMKHYITVHQQADGGWGTHIESPSTMFGTVIMYVGIRLLGTSASHPVCQRGHSFIQKHGGALMTSSWAKFYLCLLGCMDWDGHNSVPPEMWLLPNWFPFHPGRMWCHCRMVYLPMGYLYGSRFVYPDARSDPLILALRAELYCVPYESIEWTKTRHLVAPMDNYSPIGVMKHFQNILARYEKWPIFQPFKNFVRPFGLKFCVEYMAAEDLQTNYIDIGPVNKVLNMVSAFSYAQNNVNDVKVVKHIMRVADYLWVAEDGMKMQGYNGSQCWDTSFAIQAFHEAGLCDEFPGTSAMVWKYLERTQILSTKTSQSSPAYEYESNAMRETYYRHISEGGWPFSTSAHGWPISDCTGEGLKGVLCLADCKAVKDGIKNRVLQPINETRLQKSVDVIITLQNEDGGWATYENNRGWGWYEHLNPSEVFGDIMIDYSYVECSMASLTALVDFREQYPNYREMEIDHSINRGKDFLKTIQRPDGSWYGSWACCFCYGCWFGIEGLVQAGESTSCPEILKCCEFLLKHQRPNGGWGEDFTSCYDKDYAHNGMHAYGDDGSGVVNTAWALLALSKAKCQDLSAIRKGVQYLMKRQLPSGDWPQEGIAGVFNRACGITYTAYRNVFPIWALGRCVATYGEALNNTS